jgi:thiamine biosynthesis protein ThiI
MKELLLAKYGELALKGLNRSGFEAQMLKTIRRRVESCGDFKVYKAQSTVYIEPWQQGCDIDTALERLTKVFGIAAICRAGTTQKNFADICADTRAYLGPKLDRAKTFKVLAKRADKTFPMDSMELARELGGYLLSAFPHLSVRMDAPDVTVTVEIRDFAAYIHSGKIKAAGGMPTGTSGRAAVMLSGGIDSPVAAWMMAKRGLDLCGVHFMSPPYTGERARDKVVRLAKKISAYTTNFPLLCVPFTETQLAIRDGAPEEYFTILMRRSMVRITQQLCERECCGAMITGESLAQVASQTLQAIQCTDAAASLPILRPLIGMDKVEIMALSRAIDTYDISIEPYEDCCTVFTPRHPKTKPKLEEVLKAEADIRGLSALEQEAAENFSVQVLHFSD